MHCLVILYLIQEIRHCVEQYRFSTSILTRDDKMRKLLICDRNIEVTQMKQLVDMDVINKIHLIICLLYSQYCLVTMFCTNIVLLQLQIYKKKCRYILLWDVFY